MKASDIADVTKSVTKKWAKQRKREERQPSARIYRSQYIYSDREYQTEIAWEVIPKAYDKASGGGRLVTLARQIFYAARPEIEERTGRKLDSKYFTQTLLPKFMNDNPEITGGWRVAYDPRGHLIEPHGDKTIPLGTLQVDKYLRDIRCHQVKDLDGDQLSLPTRYPTLGPKHRCSAILFIEKEGFNPLFQETKLAERYDLGLMSTKGHSVVAARQLIDELCHSEVPVLVMHDFDKDGFLISESLTSVSAAARAAGRVRYKFRHKVNVIDLGLRLDDVHQWGLESESVAFRGSFGRDTITTEEERDFLRSGKRVELNAFTSPDFIAWIESKLEEHGIKKVIPDDDTLNDAYHRAVEIAYVNSQIEAVHEAAVEKANDVEVPAALADEIRDAFEEDPDRPWDDVVAEIANDRLEETDQKNEKP